MIYLVADWLTLWQTSRLFLRRTFQQAKISLLARKNVSDKTTASVAELVDALDLGSSGATRESSSLSTRTIFWVVDCLIVAVSALLKIAPSARGY